MKTLLSLAQTLSLLCITSLLTACYTETSSSSTTAKTEIDIAIAEIVDNTVTPALDSFLQETDTLFNLTASFCDSTTKAENDLLALQAQWITTNNAWFKLSPYLFGPLTSPDFLTAEAFWYIDSYRQRGNDETSSIRSDVSAMLNSTDELNATFFTKKSFTKTGLLALEVLLFETSATQLSSCLLYTSPSPRDS